MTGDGACGRPGEPAPGEPAGQQAVLIMAAKPLPAASTATHGLWPCQVQAPPAVSGALHARYAFLAGQDCCAPAPQHMPAVQAWGNGALRQLGSQACFSSERRTGMGSHAGVQQAKSACRSYLPALQRPCAPASANDASCPSQPLSMLAGLSLLPDRSSAGRRDGDASKLKRLASPWLPTGVLLPDAPPKGLPLLVFAGLHMLCTSSMLGVFSSSEAKSAGVRAMPRRTDPMFGSKAASGVT